MFEKASRLKLRFETSKGLLSVEDLWDLPVDSERDNVVTLNSIYRKITKRLKDEEGESLVTTRSKVTSNLILQADILKHIYNIKCEEQQSKKDKANRKAELKLLKQLKFEKTLDGLKALSDEELDKRMAELDVE